jgi:hypothetical protein
MERFTKGNLKVIRVAINTALREVEEAHGIKLNMGNISFDETTFRTKLEASIVNEKGIVEDRQRTDFTKYATMYDLNPEWLDKEIVLGDDTFTVTGLNTKASKNVVRIEKDNGQIYGCPSKNLITYFSNNIRVEVA